MKPLTIISSESEFLASLELERVRAAWQAKGYAAEEFAGEDLEGAFAALDTPSLFGDGRFVIVRAPAATIEAAADRFAGWATSAPEGIAAAIVLGGKGAKLRKAVGAAAEIIDVEAPKPWNVADWLVRYVKGRGRVMTKDAAAALVEAIGTDLRELATAVEQLTTATSATIGVDVVGRFFRGLESQLYTFLDAVLQRDRSTALRHLGALLRSGEHPLVLVNALSKQFRALAVARDAAGAPPATLARELGVSVGYLNRASKHGRNFDLAELRRAFRLLADADYALKGGERGDEQPAELIVEMLVGEICGDVPRAAAAARTARGRR